MEEYFYLTDQDTGIINLYVRDKKREDEIVKKYNKELETKRSAMKLDRASRVLFNKTIFFPEQWETLSHKQIMAAKRNFSRKFLLWGFTHPRALKEHCEQDYQFFVNSRNRLFNSLFMAGLIFLVANKGMKRLNPPLFYEDLFARRGISTQSIRLGILGGSGLVWAVNKYSKVVSDQFLFDTGLKYKEIISPGVFIDKQAEKWLPKKADAPAN